MDLYLFLVLLFPLLSFIISVFFNRNKTVYDLYFSLGLGYMFINELLGFIAGYYRTIYQLPFANLYSLIFPILIYLLFYKISNSESVKKQIKILSIALFVFFIIDNLIYRNFITDLQFHTYLVSTVILIYIIGKNLLQIMESDIIEEYQRSKSFWISMGLLMFYVPFIPIIFAFKFMLLNPEVRNVLNLLLIFVMNFCFIYASLFTKRK